MNARSIQASLCALTVGTSLTVAVPAFAQEDGTWEEGGENGALQGGEKKKPSETKSDDKPHPTVVLNVKFGPAFLLSAAGVTEFGLQLDFGYAVAKDLVTKRDALLITLSPGLLVRDNTILTAPLGVEYDFPLRIPVGDLYTYARASVGYAFGQISPAAFDKGYHGLVVQPAIGARLQFLDHFHIGIEPVGFQVFHFFASATTEGAPDVTHSAFQIYLFGGAHF